MDVVGALDAMSGKAIPPWESLPDIGLYMDQVVIYLDRQLQRLAPDEPESVITPSMVNNYIKGGVLPRTKGKKYSQDHLARLLVVCTLKRVLTIPDLAVLLGDTSPAPARGTVPEGAAHSGPEHGQGGDSFKSFYDLFRQAFDQASHHAGAVLGQAVDGLKEPAGPAILRPLAARLAAEASLMSLAAEGLLRQVRNIEAARGGAVEKKPSRRVPKTGRKISPPEASPAP